MGSSAPIPADRRGRILSDNMVKRSTRPQDLQIEPKHHVHVECKLQSIAEDLVFLFLTFMKVL